MSAQPGGVPRVVTAHAPARLDFGGGWTDVPPYCDREGGTVCNLAIARRATVVLGDPRAAAPATPNASAFDRRADGPAAGLVRAALRRAGLDGAPPPVGTRTDLPVGAGLGGSSALGVALAAACAAWRGPAARRDGQPDDPGRAALAEASRAAEVEDAGIAGGRQDHYAAAFGGALRLDFGAAAGGAPARVTRLPLSDATRRALERRCVVVYTGESRISGDTITAVLDAYAAGGRRVVDALARMRALAGAMAAALAGGDVDALGALVGEHWASQRALHPAIPTARIDAIVAAGGKAGALGAKALGASGGGCVLLVAAEGREAAVRAAVGGWGALVEFAVDADGVRVQDGA
ncbi:GHMP kinase [Gemmatimonadetes bacterium T265]|nr:GHMP kinase [Gemmatimonadetes bacterium T265]